MGKKYIIELEDKPFHNGNGDFLYRVKGFNSLVFDMTGVGKLTPYTEPDLEQVRKEAYEKGLSDAWKAARWIADRPYAEGEKVFGVAGWHIIEKFTVSEAIEKIRQYEQRQEEIQVGDEVELDDGETAIWMRDNSDEDTAYLMFSDGSCGSNENSEIVRKTGRHFPEIAEVLRKMRESE